MDKPFDTKDLTEKLKAQGLPLVEDLASKVFDSVSAWLKESAAIHDSAVVKALVPALMDVVNPLVKAQIDKIDGVVG